MSIDRMFKITDGLVMDLDDIEHAEKLNIKLGLHIGSGTYSHVYKASLGSKPVALKSCDRTGVVKPLVDQELAVFNVLKDRPHKNIIKFFESFENYDKTKVWILMELFSGVDLAEKLMMNGGPLEERVAKIYFKQMVEGLVFLHKLAIVHRDIKLDNILVGFDSSQQQTDGNECIKLIDFGFSKIVDIEKTDGSAKCNSRLGTEVYMAPELLNVTIEDYDAFKSDVYSLAIVLFALLYNRFPDRQTATDDNPVVRTSSIIFPQEDPGNPKVSESVKKLISNMSCSDSTKRFNLNQILDSEWVKNSV